MKHIIVLSAAIAITSVFTACSDKNASSVSEAESTTERISPKRISFEWQDAYRSEIDEFKASGDFSPQDSRFDLRDLNSDGTPELIISPSADADVPCRIYSFSDGTAAEIGDDGNFGSFEFFPESGVFNNEHVGSGFTVGEYRTITDNSFKTVLNYYNNMASASSGAVITYEINKKEVTLKQYNEAIEEYSLFPSLLIGRKYTFGNSAVENALCFSDGWNAVLSDKEKEIFRSKLTELKEQYDGFAAFELCDLDKNDIPELIFSEGISPDSSCRIFTLNEEQLTELEGTYGSGGKLEFDAEKNVFFSLDASTERNCWNLTNEPLDGYAESDSIVEIGRKYLLSDSSIASAFS